MPITIEQFKEAFAGQTTDDGLQGRDRDFARALKQLDQSIAGHAGGNGAGDGFQAARDRIVELYREARRATAPARETAVQLDGLLRQASMLTTRLEQTTASGGSSAPALAQSAAQSTSSSREANKNAPTDAAAPRQITLEFHVQGGQGMQTGGTRLANATVQIGGQTQTTDGEGFARFTLPAAVYDYRVSAEGHQELTGRVDVSATADVESHGVVLSPVNAPREDVIVRVLDARTRQPIEEALVAFNGELEQSNRAGEARFIDVAIGADPYGYEVRKTGYDRLRGSFVHDGTQGTSILNVELQPAATTPGDPAQTPAGGAGTGGERPADAPGTPPTTGAGDAPPTGGAGTGSADPPAGGAVTTPGTGSAGGAGSASQHTSQILKRGSRGPAVAFLQERLNQEGASLEADGIFGPVTQRAVRKFQQDHDLNADGIVGPLTWGALLDSRAAGATEGINIDAPVQQARELQGRLEQSSDPSEQAQLARQLLQIDNQLRSQLARAPLGPDGLPLLIGQVEWDRNSPLAGTLDDINPFGARDSWSVYARAQDDSPRTPLRNRTLRIRMRVPADYAAFRTMVVEWIGGFVVRTRADDLVDASNLRQRYEPLAIPRGTDRELLVVAELIAGTARYESVRFSLEGAPADDELDVPDPGGGGPVGDAVGDGVHVNPDDFVEENAALLILDAVGQTAGFAGMMAGVFVLELAGLGAGVIALLGGYYVFVQQLDSTLRAAGERLAREIAVRAAANLAASLRRGEYDGQQVTFNELYRHGDRSASMQARIGDWIGQARTVPNPQEFIDRLIEESIRRMASLLTQQLAAVQRHYRAELEQRARSLVPADAVNSLVERAYVRNISRIRGRFLQDLTAAAMQRL